MTLLLALTIGILYGAAFFMLLRRSIVKLVIGLILLSHAANLLIFTAGGLFKGTSPIIEPGLIPALDPLPQALILTAIVIGFGVTAYMVMLLYRIFLDQKTTNAGDLYNEEDRHKEFGVESDPEMEPGGDDKNKEGQTDPAS